MKYKFYKVIWIHLPHDIYIYATDLSEMTEENLKYSATFLWLLLTKTNINSDKTLNEIQVL